MALIQNKESYFYFICLTEYLEIHIFDILKISFFYASTEIQE